MPADNDICIGNPQFIRSTEENFMTCNELCVSAKCLNHFYHRISHACANRSTYFIQRRIIICRSSFSCEIRRRPSPWRLHYELRTTNYLWCLQCERSFYSKNFHSSHKETSKKRWHPTPYLHQMIWSSKSHPQLIFPQIIVEFILLTQNLFGYLWW